MSTSKQNVFVLLLVLIISAAANSALLANYHFHYDDYRQLELSTAEWLQARGIWRISGIMLPAWFVHHHMYGIAAVLVHAITGYFFFQVARRAFASVGYALLITMIMMAFPWGHQALVWASAMAYALAACLLWAIIWAMLSYRTDQHRPYLFALGLMVASFLSLLMHEAVFFSICVVGFVILMKPRFWCERKSTMVVAFAPLIGALLWWAIYELTEPANSVYSANPANLITNLNFRSALSALLYQYRGLEIFDVWTIPALREHALSTLQPVSITLTFLTLCAVPFLVRAILRPAPSECESLSQEERPIRPEVFLVWMILICGGAAFVYVLAGGYALDNRKRYIITPILIMATAAAIWLIWRPAKARAFWSRSSSSAIAAICVFGCVTSLLITSIWKSEMKRLDLLANLVVENGLSGDRQVDWSPDLTKLWPNSEKSWGFPAQVALDEALRHQGARPVLLSAQSDSAEEPQNTNVVRTTDLVFVVTLIAAFGFVLGFCLRYGIRAYTSVRRRRRWRSALEQLPLHKAPLLAPEVERIRRDERKPSVNPR